MPKRRHTLSIFLLKRDVVMADAMRHTRPDQTYTVRFQNGVTGSLFVGSTHRSRPSWYETFENLAGDLPNVWSSNVPALLTISHAGCNFALPFGYGKSMLNPGVWEEDFGLKVTLNSVDASKLRSIDRMSFDAIGQHSRIQASREADISEFGLNLEQDMLRAVIGKPTDPALGTQLTGRDSLKASISMNIEELPDLLTQYHRQWTSTAYRARFPWVDQIGEVKSPAIVDDLNGEVIAKLVQREFGRLWLSIPELIEWTTIAGFKYRDARNAQLHSDVHISEYLDEVTTNRFDLKFLKRRQIQAVNEEGREVNSWPVFRCLYSEIERGGKTYLLTNGKWYCVSDGFLERVDAAFAAMPRAAIALPNYTDGSEQAYNTRVSQGAADQYALMDSDLISCDGPNGSIEFCDLFSRQKHIIHVKRYTGSSAPLSHLFAQALTSATTFRRDEAFRREADQRLPGPFRPIRDQPKPQEYEVVLGVVSKSPRPLRLPFFSRVNLNATRERIEDLGYKISLLKIQTIN